MAKIIIQGKDYGSHLVDVSLKLVRTYLGEVQRTSTGLVTKFPDSFITVGFDLSFTATRQEIQELEQLFLSADLLSIALGWDPYSVSGRFSCTSNAVTYLRDRDESMATLAVSIVSDGSAISSYEGQPFTVKTSANVTVLSPCYFGRVYTVPAQYSTYKLGSSGGHTLPDGHILVLKDVTLYP